MLHVATQAPQMPGDRWWVVELREARHVEVGERIDVGGGASFELAAPYAGGTRLWLARFDGDGPLPAHLAATAARSATAYVPQRLAARRLPDRLRRSSPAAPRCPAPGARSPPSSSPGSWRAGSSSRRSCSTPACPHPSATSRPTPSATPCRSDRAGSSTTSASSGGRVIAVGTTVVRALETAAAPDGTVSASDGLDRPGRHARARPARHRRPDHRLARARGVTPAAARGRHRRARSCAAATTRRSPPATSGTSSATATSSCRDPRGAQRRVTVQVDVDLRHQAVVDLVQERELDAQPRLVGSVPSTRPLSSPTATTSRPSRTSPARTSGRRCSRRSPR